jgi:hypothetical protein
MNKLVIFSLELGANIDDCQRFFFFFTHVLPQQLGNFSISFSALVKLYNKLYALVFDEHLNYEHLVNSDNVHSSKTLEPITQKTKQQIQNVSLFYGKCLAGSVRWQVRNHRQVLMSVIYISTIVNLKFKRRPPMSAPAANNRR